MNHPLSKYGLALVLHQNRISEENISALTHEMLINELKVGLRHFRFHTENDPELTESLVYKYYGLEEFEENPNLIQSAGLSGKGMFLSQNILTEEKSAKKVYAAVNKIISLLEQKISLNKAESITMSISPVSGKINQGKISQSNPNGSLLEVACYAIGTTHPIKASFSSNNLNYGLIPDLPLDQQVNFISFFNKMYSDNLGNLLKARTRDGKYKRPFIIRGNYPDAPHHAAFGPVGLIAAIGKWSKEANISEGLEVLESVKEVPIYLFGYGKAEVLRFSYYVVELAKENKLYKIILDLENSTLLNEERKSFDNPKYQRFHLFISRFLQLYNAPAFKDFLSFRAYYEPSVDQLFISYFINVELKSLDMAISQEIVASAREMGKWLNYAAYKAAVQNEEKGAGTEAVLKSKAKFLIELESAAFSAKSGEELISHVVTRAGRLTGMDIPPEAQSFMDATCTETITQDQAKHLITAYSRLRNKFEKKEEKTEEENHSLEIN